MTSKAYMNLASQITVVVELDEIPRDLIHDIITTTLDKLDIVLNDDDAIRLNEWRKENNRR